MVSQVAEINFWSDFVSKSKISGPEDSEHSELPPLADPESNVFSFGIVLLETISGKLPYSAGQGSLLNWVSCKWHLLYANCFIVSSSNFGWINIEITNFSGCWTLEWQAKHQLPYWPDTQVLQKQRAWHDLWSNPGLHQTQSEGEADDEGNHFKTEGSDQHFTWLSNTKTFTALVGWTRDPVRGGNLISDSSGL